MSFRLEMLQVARLAPSVLGDATSLVESFIHSKKHESGGYVGRNDQPDLYYTSFAVDGITALNIELPEADLSRYLLSFGEGENLDFIHLCCLIRIWSAIKSIKPPEGLINSLMAKVEEYRTPDGGYDQSKKSEKGSSYGCLIAYGAHADHGQSPSNMEGLTHCLQTLKTPEGAWVNDPDIPVPNAPATAAAVTVCRNLRVPVQPNTTEWLLSCFHPQGGFLPFPGAPMPDLLSTAVALHALDGLQVPLVNIKDPCLDFIDSLWTNKGGFHGNWADEYLDLEYTYYGLLALGHLSL